MTQPLRLPLVEDNRLLILLVEDEWLIADTLADELREHGATVQVAATLADAIHAFTTFAPNGVITDWRFPVKAGQPPQDNAGALLLQWLAANHPRVPFVVHSGSMFGTIASIAQTYNLRLTPQDVLSKGAPPRDLYARLIHTCGVVM